MPTFLVSRLARRNVTVSLSADGGVELFAGYWRYWKVLNDFFPKYNNIFFRKLIQLAFFFGTEFYAGIISSFYKKYDDISDKLKKTRLLFNSRDFNEFYFNFNRFFLPDELKKIGIFYDKNQEKIYKEKTDIDILHRMMLFDFSYYLPDDILVKVDRASMACSLESREPYLDNKVIEYIASRESNLKYRDGISKYILKEILNKYIPSEYINRPKKGFSAPVKNWLQNELKDNFNYYLSEDFLQKQKIFNIHNIKRIANLFYNDKRVNPQKIWLIYIFQMWYDKWMN